MKRQTPVDYDAAPRSIYSLVRLCRPTLVIIFLLQGFNLCFKNQKSGIVKMKLHRAGLAS